MSKLNEIRLIFHGAVILFFGMMLGFLYRNAIVHAWGDEPIRAWKAVHLAAMMLGFMTMIVGCTASRLRLSQLLERTLVWSLILSSYVFSIGMAVGATVGQRGLGRYGPTINHVMAVVFDLCFIGSLLSIAITIYGAYQKLCEVRRASSADVAQRAVVERN